MASLSGGASQRGNAGGLAVVSPVSGLRYRPDIDGLRAIAVCAVILFHAQIGRFRGGFVGVDIFFVISGYLITSIVTDDIDGGRFSLLRFYDRRIRRIFPALFVMLAATSVAAYAFLLPTDLATYGKTLLSTALFSSNLYFWREAGYFGEDASRNILLHTWSLGVEEQFYLFFPLLLLLVVGNRGRRAMPVLLLLLGLSLLIAEWQVHVRPSASFYLLPMRAWELLLGAVLALAALPPPGRRLAGLIGAAGLAMIGWSLFFFSPVMDFPGLSALVPCLGTAMLIHAGSAEAPSGSAALLGSAPLVFIGQLSYALYLWHWPLLALPRLYSGGDLSFIDGLAAIVLTLVLATLSWRYVEAPLRRRKAAGEEGRTVAVALIASLGFLLLGGVLAMSGGAPWRYSPRIVAADRAQLLPDLPASCFGPEADGQGCPDSRYDILVWGDSHAGHYFPAVDHIARRLGLKAQLQSVGGCPPLPGLVPVVVPSASEIAQGQPVDEQAECVGVNARVMNEVLHNPSVKGVILAGAWSFWSEGNELDTREGRFLVAPGRTRYSVARSRAAMKAALAATVRRLRQQGLHVMLLGQVPESRLSPSRCMAISFRASETAIKCAPDSAATMRRLAWSRALLRSVSHHYHAFLFLPAMTLCKSPRCAIIYGGQPLYRDSDHITPAGAIALANHLDRRFFRFASPSLRAATASSGPCMSGGKGRPETGGAGHSAPCLRVSGDAR